MSYRVNGLIPTTPVVYNVTEIYVDLDGRGQYTSLESAIAAYIGSGAIIRVGPGIHTCNSQHCYGVTIRGSGIDRTIIRDTTPSGGIFKIAHGIATADFRVSDCTLRLTQHNGSNTIGIFSDSLYKTWVERVKIEIDCPSARKSSNDSYYGVMALSTVRAVTMILKDVWIDFSNMLVVGNPTDTPTSVPAMFWTTSIESIVENGFLKGDSNLNFDLFFPGTASAKVTFIDVIMGNGPAGISESNPDTIVGRYINNLTKQHVWPDNIPFVVDSPTLVANLNSDKTDGADLDTDGTLAANSDSKIPSQKATKTYADTKVPKVSANRPGVTKLYRNDADDGYSIQTAWDGARWILQGYYPNNTYHAPARVGYADAAGTASLATLATAINTGCIVYRNSAQSLTNNAWTVLTWTGYYSNPQSLTWWDGATAIFAPANGWYIVFGTAQTSGTGGTNRQIGFALNSNLWYTHVDRSVASFPGGSNFATSLPIYMTAGQYVQLGYFHDTGSNQNCLVGTPNAFTTSLTPFLGLVRI